MVYFIYSSFSPNNASNNRALAYLKALSKLHFKVSVFFLMPDVRHNRITEDLPEISITYCWEKNYHRGRISKYLSYIRYLIGIYRMVQPGDIVYLYFKNNYLNK